MVDLFFRKESGNWLVGNSPVPVQEAKILMDVPFAKLQLMKMHAHICPKTLRLTMAFLNRKMRQLSKGIYLQQRGFDEIKRLLQSGERVVIMPVLRSFADLPVLLYSLFVNKIEIPFTIGNAEDLPAAKFIDRILKKVGYIITARTRDQSL